MSDVASATLFILIVFFSGALGGVMSAILLMKYATKTLNQLRREWDMMAQLDSALEDFEASNDDEADETP